MIMRSWIVCLLLPAAVMAEANKVLDFTFNSPVGFVREAEEGADAATFRSPDNQGQIRLRAMKRGALEAAEQFERIVARFAENVARTSTKVERQGIRKEGTGTLPRMVGGLSYETGAQGTWMLDLVLVTPPGEGVNWILVSAQFPRARAPSWRTSLGSILASLQRETPAAGAAATAPVTAPVAAPPVVLAPTATVSPTAAP